MARIDKHFTREVVAVDAAARCRDAARLMLDRRIGAVAIRERDKIVGLLTERDLVAATLEADATGAERVTRWMRRSLPTVPPSASEADCAALMRDHYTRHLLVEEHGDVIGIISMRDVIRLMLDEKQFLIEQLESYISRG